MHSIPDVTNDPQGVTSEFASTNDVPIALDHEDEEAMRRRLDEWRSMAANLTGGFTQMPDQVRKDNTLSSNAKLVYEHLLSYMWSKEWCWPSQARLAKELGISRRTVIRVCKELHDRFYVEKWRRGLGRTNVYFVNPLNIVISTGITLTEINLPLPIEIKPDNPLTEIYGTHFYADDPHYIGECQNDTTRSDKSSQPNMPECHTKNTKMKNTESNDRDSKYSGEAKKGTTSPSATIRNEQEQTKANERDTDKKQITNVASLPKTSKSSKNNGNTAPAAPKPSAQARAIAESTGIPTEHLEELGINPEPRKRPIPDFITRYMTDYTRDLGDATKSRKSNITRMTKLYYFALDFCEHQDDPEGWFCGWMQDAKREALFVQNVEKRTGTRVNRMPVFFSCLEKKFKFEADELIFLRSDLPLLEPEDR